MKIREIADVKTLDFAAEGFQYIWLQEYGRVVLGPLRNEKNINFDRLIEARVFNNEKEVHIYDDDGLKAIEIVHESGDECFEEVQMLRGKFGKTITLRHYVGFDDEDQQAYVKHTVLCNYVAK